jgi:hypothetical protein
MIVWTPGEPPLVCSTVSTTLMEGWPLPELDELDFLTVTVLPEELPDIELELEEEELELEEEELELLPDEK